MTGTLKARIAKLEESRQLLGIRKVLARSGNEALVDAMRAMKEPAAQVLYLLGQLSEDEATQLRRLLAEVPSVASRMPKKETGESDAKQ